MGSDIPKYRQLQEQRRADRLYLLGHITHNWNGLEHQLAYHMAIHSTDHPLAYALAARLRSAELTTALEQVVAEREPRKRIRDAYRFAVSAFHILRENRNILVHSHHNLEITGHQVLWTRPSKTNPRHSLATRGNLRDLDQVTSGIARLHIYLIGLGAVVVHYKQVREGKMPRDAFPPAWPQRFPLPRKLAQIPPTPLGAPRRPRSSRP